jgi:hypothetical protein
MTHIQHPTRGERLGRYVAQVLLTTAALAAITTSAHADVCFPTPVAVPGLSGVPLWEGNGVLRAELNEPRWAAAPLTWFASDPTGTDGLYWIIVDSAYSELSVSFQAPTDLGSVSNADVVYFGFTTDGTTGLLAKGVSISANNSGTVDPTDAAIIQPYTYDMPEWTSPLGPAPTWLKAASVWRNNVAGDAAWGINFKIDIANAGLSPSMAFKIFFGMRKQDELDTSKSVKLSTPDPGANAVLANTLFIEDPVHWANAVAINSGCSGGVTISGTQIGTLNMNAGSPAPTQISTENGAVNRFFAKPSLPGSLALLFPGLFQAKFHLANWTSANAPDAPWAPIPNGAVVLNGVAPATDNGSIEFDCPANTATTTCGIPTPSIAHQAVYVELMPSPTQTVQITTAAAYREMDFTSPAGSAGSAGSGGAAIGTAGSIGEGGDAGEGGTSNVSGPPSNSVAGASAGMSAHAGDAGDTATNSAGSPGNAGAAAVTTGDGKGDTCGCRVVGRKSPPLPDLVALLALGISLGRRRRARREEGEVDV